MGPNQYYGPQVSTPLIYAWGPWESSNTQTFEFGMKQGWINCNTGENTPIKLADAVVNLINVKKEDILLLYLYYDTEWRTTFAVNENIKQLLS